MANWIPLRCPTCNAHLQVDGNSNQFTCNHCGTAYLLEQNAREIARPEREQLSPLTTYTHHLQQWLKVGSHEVFVHSVIEEKIQTNRVIFANVEYRNNGREMLSCRRNQWVLYDAEGYTYDTVSDTALFADRPALSGERFINPGMRLRGWIAFKAPSTATVERLQFLTGFLTTKTAEFLLKP